MATRGKQAPKKAKAKAAPRGVLDRFASRLAEDLADPMSNSPEEIRRIVSKAADDEGLGPATSAVTIESVHEGEEWSTRVRIEVRL